LPVDDSKLFTDNGTGGTMEVGYGNENSVCETCGKAFWAVLFVEEENKTYCFYCHRNKFGHERFMFCFNRMSKRGQIGGFEESKGGD